MFKYKGFKISFAITLLLVFSVKVIAQQVFEDVDSAATHITNSYNMLLNNYILTGNTMQSEMVDELESSTIKSRSVMKFRKQFEDDAKYKFNMIYAFIDYFRGDGDKAVSRAKSVYRAAKDNDEMRDCYLYLAYLNKDYEGIAKNARLLHMGAKVSDAIDSGNQLLNADVQRTIMANRAQSGGSLAGIGDPNNANSIGGSMVIPDPNIPGAQRPGRAGNPMPMGGPGGFGGGLGRPANTMNTPQQPTRPSGNRGNRGNRGGGGGGMGFGVGGGMGGMMPVDSNSAFQQGSNRPTRPVQPGGMRQPRQNNLQMGLGANQQQAQASALNLNLDYMSASMLGKKLNQMTLQDINGSFMSYSPDQGKLLCMLLWSYGDSMLEGQRRAFLDTFTEVAGGMGKAQFVAVNCNEVSYPIATKVLVDNIAKSPSPWVNCILSSENKLQLADIEPASPVMLIADTSGIVRYVGPADSTIVNAILRQENLKSSELFGEMPQGSGLMGSGMQGLGKFVNTMGQMMSQMSEEDLKKAAANQAAVTPVNKTVSKPIENTAPRKVNMEDDATILQARNILQLAETKMKIKFGISFGSALDLCDQVIEGWPGTEEAEQAKAYVREILSKGRGQVYKRDRIRQGKYVGEEE